MPVYLQYTSQKIIKNNTKNEIKSNAYKNSNNGGDKDHTPHLFHALIHGIFYVYIMLSKQKVEVKAASVVKGIQEIFFHRMIFELMLGDLFSGIQLNAKMFLTSLRGT